MRRNANKLATIAFVTRNPNAKQRFSQRIKFQNYAAIKIRFAQHFAHAASIADVYLLNPR